MTHRSKAGLMSRIASQLPSTGRGEINGAKLRDVLTDMVDSLEAGAPPIPVIWAGWWGADASYQADDPTVDELRARGSRSADQ